MRPSAVVRVSGGRVEARVPYGFRDVPRSVLYVMWDPGVKSWVAPLHAGRRLVLALETAGMEVRFVGDAWEVIASVVDPYEEAKRWLSVPGDQTPQPPIRRGEDWEHQRRGFWFAKDLPGVLLDVWMGGGKTRITINLIQNCALGGKVLVVAPVNVCPVWKREIMEKHGAREAMWYVEDLTSRNVTIDRKMKWMVDALSRNGTRVIVINYESVWREPIAKRILAEEWDIVVADECHRIKSPDSRVSKFFARLASRAKKRVGLTGTPFHNSPLDIYGQARFIAPGLFGGNLAAFRSRFAVMGGFQGKQVVGLQNEDDFMNRFRMFAYSVRKDEVLTDLPEMSFLEVPFQLSPEERKVYKSLEHDFYAELEEGKTVMVQNVLSKLIKLQQVTSGFVRTEDGTDIPVGNSKASALEEILEDLPLDEPVAVFCRFTSDIDRVAQIARKVGRKCYELSGRARELEAWQNSTTPGDVLAVQMQSGGVGVDMTRARYIIDYSLTFSYGDWEQSRSRIRRPGQTRPTVSIVLLAQDTIDIRIWHALQKKKDIIQDLLERGLDSQG